MSSSNALSAILDTLIPPSDDGRLPGAGELGLAGLIAEKAPELGPLVDAAIADLDARAGAPGFAGLPAREREAFLRAYAEENPALVPGLVFHTYTAYYEQPRVVEALGLEHRPPHPLGYAMQPTDPKRLDAMRRRPPLYRET